MNPPVRPASDGPIRARYDDAARPEPTEDEIDGYAARLPRDAGLVLDAACGSGRLLVPLVARGIAMQGADGSAASLALAQARLAAQALSATLYRQDLAALNLPMRYAAAILDGEAFSRIADPEAARAALERLRAHLVDPGLLVVEAREPAFAHSRPGAPLVEVSSVALDDGSQIRTRSETIVDAETRIARTEARYTHRRGAQALGEEHARLVRTWYDAEALRAIVEAAGFRDAACERSEPGADDRETAFVVTARA